MNEIILFIIVFCITWYFSGKIFKHLNKKERERQHRTAQELTQKFEQAKKDNTTSQYVEDINIAQKDKYQKLLKRQWIEKLIWYITLFIVWKYLTASLLIKIIITVVAVDRFRELLQDRELKKSGIASDAEKEVYKKLFKN